MYSSQQKKLVTESLERILRSEGFAQAPQLRNFLDFVVKKTLANKSGEIKGYTIGVDALGRSPDFDPHTDPTVRVMAGRLRQALKSYHAENNDPADAVINIPKGTYVPQFTFSSAKDTKAPARAIKFGFLPVAVLLFLLAMITYWTANSPGLRNDEPRATISTNDTNAARISVSLRINEDEIPRWFSAQEAIAGLITAFSKFNEFEIYQVPSSDTKIGPANTLADYHFSVLIARAGTSQDIRAFTKLKRQSDGVIVSSEAIAIARPDGETGIDASQIAGRTISPLLSPYGVIYGDISNRKSVPKHLECINRFYTYFAAETPDKYTSARKCTRSVVQSGTASSSIFAMQAFLQIEAFRKEITAYEADPLAAAKLSARKAIELDPQNARAHQAQFGVFKVNRHEAKAIEAATKAIELNPFDSDIIGDFAAYLISVGRFKQAEPWLAKAVFLNPSLPVWLEFFVYLYAELTGDFTKADISASHLNPDASPLAALAILISAHRNKNTDGARKAYQKLIAQEADFETDPVAALLRRGFSQEITDKISSVILSVGRSK